MQATYTSAVVFDTLLQLLSISLTSPVQHLLMSVPSVVSSIKPLNVYYHFIIY